MLQFPNFVKNRHSAQFLVGTKITELLEAEGTVEKTAKCIQSSKIVLENFSENFEKRARKECYKRSPLALHHKDSLLKGKFEFFFVFFSTLSSLELNMENLLIRS